MRVAEFSLLIPQGREMDSGHVLLTHGTQYHLRMGNHSHVSCDAVVDIDGKEIGAFRIYPGQYFNLERPAHDQGCFTFFRVDSDQAKAAGGDKVVKENRGLVQVTFKPEKQAPVRYGGGGILRTRGMSSFAPEAEEKTAGGLKGMNTSAGMTGLTGKSNQNFTNVAPLDYDLSKQVTISLRLVADANEVRELTPAQPQANPVPGTVD